MLYASSIIILHTPQPPRSNIRKRDPSSLHSSATARGDSIMESLYLPPGAAREENAKKYATTGEGNASLRYLEVELAKCGVVSE